MTSRSIDSVNENLNDEQQISAFVQNFEIPTLVPNLELSETKYDLNSKLREKLQESGLFMKAAENDE